MADTNQRIAINPVTRVEGHAKITIQFGGNGQVQEARFHVNEFRGFEKFCEGRYFTEMPSITPRICGICPVSHAVASAKAGEQIMRVHPPRPGQMVRKLIHLGQIVASHALSFFHLSSPDFLLGWETPPETRNILGLAEKFPDLARRGVRLRKFGQEISQRVTGKKIHVMGIIAGGMTVGLTEENRLAILQAIPEAIETTHIALNLFKKYREEHLEEVENFANFESLYMGTVDRRGGLELYDGRLRVIRGDGSILADQLDPASYLDWIAEQPVHWSYLKFPFFKPLGFGAGFYRVGPLARLNVADSVPTPLAAKEFAEWRRMGNGKPVQGSFYYHYARLIETLFCLEQIEEIVCDADVTSTHIRARAARNQAEGVGCAEAPRGTLFHHYVTHENGALKKVNLLIATGQNNPAMNEAILQVAKQWVPGPDAPESALNRVEAAIRCYDPCLSCSTHALGQMPLEIEFLDRDGRSLRILRRGA